MKKKIFWIISILFFLSLIYFGYLLFKIKQYYLVSVLIVIIGLIPFFIRFETKKEGIEKIVLIAVFTAIASLSRIIFNIVPHGFNPVAAIVILIALVFGKDMGFMVGALTALLSNTYLLQGPWTPFQMLGWGLVGYFAGVFSGILKSSKIFLLVYGVIAAIFYSLLLDVLSVLFIDNSFNFSRYIAIIVSSFLFTLNYIISNFLFLLLFSYLFLNRMERIVLKYEINK